MTIELLGLLAMYAGLACVGAFCVCLVGCMALELVPRWRALPEGDRAHKAGVLRSAAQEFGVVGCLLLFIHFVVHNGG